VPHNAKDRVIEDAVAAEREACAKIAEDYAARARAVYKCQAPETLSFRWADPRTAGQADAGDDIAAAIRVRSAGGQPDAA